MKAVVYLIHTAVELGRSPLAPPRQSALTVVFSVKPITSLSAKRSKIDRSMPIVAETEQMPHRRNFLLGGVRGRTVGY
jgi:hypothetical protein